MKAFWDRGSLREGQHKSLLAASSLFTWLVYYDQLSVADESLQEWASRWVNLKRKRMSGEWVAVLWAWNWVSWIPPGWVSRRTAIASMEGGDCCEEENKVAELKRQTAYFEVFSGIHPEQTPLPIEAFQLLLSGCCRQVCDMVLPIKLLCPRQICTLHFIGFMVFLRAAWCLSQPNLKELQN